jgi:hypothetical protein
VFLVLPNDLFLTTSVIILRAPNMFFANNLKSPAASSITDCTDLQSDIDSMYSWCAANNVELTTDKIRAITFSTKMFTINNNYKVYDTCITHTHSVNDVGVFLVSKLFSSITMYTT